MPGKRPRQILRTASTLQLGRIGTAMGARFSQPLPEDCHGDVGTPEGISAPLKQDLLEAMEVCTEVEEAVALEENSNSMTVDGSVEGSVYASHADQSGALDQAMRPVAQNPTDLGESSHPGYLTQPLHNNSMAVEVSFDRGHEAGRSAQPTHFLDVCFLCAKRLGHGRDVFIYRGDRAFCSVECRHSQIVADEMREKCGMAAAKEGVGANALDGNSASTKQVETAAAA